jgi:hypothetical protein
VHFTKGVVSEINVNVLQHFSWRNEVAQQKQLFKGYLKGCNGYRNKTLKEHDFLHCILTWFEYNSTY